MTELYGFYRLYYEYYVEDIGKINDLLFLLGKS